MKKVEKNIEETGIKKVEDINSYSSDTSEKITREELKEKING